MFQFHIITASNEYVIKRPLRLAAWAITFDLIYWFYNVLWKMNKKLCHIDYFQLSCSVLENLLNKPSAIQAGHKPHLKRIIGCQEYIEKS